MRETKANEARCRFLEQRSDGTLSKVYAAVAAPDAVNKTESEEESSRLFSAKRGACKLQRTETQRVDPEETLTVDPNSNSFTQVERIQMLNEV